MANKMEKLDRCPLCGHSWPLRRLPNNKYFCTCCEKEFRVKRNKQGIPIILIYDILEDGEAKVSGEISFPNKK